MAKDLRGHLEGRAQHRCGLLALWEGLRKAKVSELKLVPRPHDIRRLDIAVNEAFFVYVLQAKEYLSQNLHAFLFRESSV